jgi:SAM-dependent methyltransferase
LLLNTIDDLLAQPAARVLDVGAGSVVEKNERAGQRVLAEKYARLVKLPGYIGLDVQAQTSVKLVGDAHTLPVANAALDGVLMVSVLEHLYDPVRAVNEVARVLKPGGVFFSYAPFYHPYHGSPHDYFRFTQEGYRSLLGGFAAVEIVSGGNYVAVVNDVASQAFGGSRPGRVVARLLIEFPLSFLFRAFDASQPSDIAVGFAARAFK